MRPSAIVGWLLAAPPVRRTRAAWALTAIRVGSAAVFISFGAGKFLNHASETASFRTYGLPWPGAFAGVIGVVELVGGALLLAGVATRLAAVVLAGDMIGAIITSGILHGESISLTLAPVMLGAMVVLAALGSGPLALAASVTKLLQSPPDR